MPLSLADELLYSTINIACLKDNTPIGSGTGFFWITPIGVDKHIVTIVTNKHVIDGADAIIAVCHEAEEDGKGPSGQFANCIIRVGEGVVLHPDGKTDLCAIPVSGLLNQAQEAGRPLFYKAMRAENVPSEDQWASFDSIENVLMIGCPRGISDQFNNLPIVRRGITATPLGKNFEGRAEFMVDIACFPGSSGSPVFMLSQEAYFDRKADGYTLGGRFFFLGALYCGPIINNEGKIVLSEQPRVEVAAMMHLGQVIKSTELLELQKEITRRVEVFQS